MISSPLSIKRNSPPIWTSSFVELCLACRMLSCLFILKVSIAGAEPGKQFVVTRYGAVADGRTLNTRSIQRTIDAAAKGGGGTVIIPDGTFVSGAIFLKPGVELHLEKDAVLKGSTDIREYPKMKTRIEGGFRDWVPALINADRTDHLRITGPGTLDGNGAPFWKEFWDRRKANAKTTNLDVPRPRLALIQNSKDVLISGVRFRNSGFWNLHLYRCSDARRGKRKLRSAAMVNRPIERQAPMPSTSTVASA